jgi:cyclopropane fatty-acyl-phospholipid synthase-like methyltransferase
MTSDAKPTRNRRSLAPEYFEQLYTKDEDPWHFATSAYEQSKYKATLEILKGQPLGRVFEVGCSIGVLTKALALNCDSVLAVDVSEIALSNAMHSCGAHGNVTISYMRIPAEWPAGSFDLILLSEVLYYLGPADVRATARKTSQSLSSTGRVLLVNWLGETDYPCGGDEACNIFMAAAKNDLQVIKQRRNRDYRLDLLGLASSQAGDA